MRFIKYIFFIALIFLISCQEESATTPEEKNDIEKIADHLPFTRYELTDLSNFKSEGTNWVIGSAVTSDFQKPWDLSFESGSGILVNNVKDQGVRDQDNAADGAHLFSNIEHGDIEIEFEVLLPKESNSGVYFQGRYELQLRDTAEDEQLSSDDLGGVYAQWKNADQKETIGGSAPILNAARSAGLWQKFKVLFRAPRFDAQGNKTANAKFDHIYLNDYLIQKNVEVTGPTIGSPHADEVALAPFMIQGDHGPIAIRNIDYKTYTNESVKLSNLTYKVFKGKFDYIPDFSTLEVIKEGAAENFDDLESLAGMNDGFCMVFEGDIQVPRDGQYLFETGIDDGGNTYIDGQLIVHNQGDPGYGTERGVVELTKGTHKLKQSYYEEVWGARINMKIEGPGMEKAEFPMRDQPQATTDWPVQSDFVLEVGDEPELIRGFADHYGQKKTHILSVGTPQGIHYSYDTRNNELINLWKGEFADVTRMWNGRGAEQRLDPVAAELSITDMSDSNCKPNGYTIGSDGLPTFRYTCDNMNITDKVSPTEGKKSASRVISVDKGSYQYEVASGDGIKELSDGWYSIDNQYFVRSNNADANWKVSDDKIVATIAPSSELSYEIYW